MVTEREIVLEAEELSKCYGGRSVLERVSISVQRGQVVTIVGPNGGGKTTLLRLLMGIEQPDTGTVRLKPGLKIGYVPQRLVFDATMPLTVDAFLKLQLSRHVDKQTLATICSEAEINELLQRQVSTLSGGEKQRVLFAGALLRAPELLVLDEPMQGIDVIGQAAFYDVISRVCTQRHCAVLMVSHDLHLVMASTDEVVCLHRHVCCSGHPRKVSKDPVFREMFGNQVALNLAVYAHHHDHTHDNMGQVGQHDAME